MSAEGLVDLLVAVDGGDLGDTGERFGGRFVGGLEVLAVAAPWRVELDNLEAVSAGRFVNGRPN